MKPMSQTDAGESAAGALPRRAFTTFQAASSVAVVAVAGLLGAAVAVASANGFSFGMQAAVEAGDNPPQEVSRRVESLLALQAYANALLAGIALSSLLAVASRTLRAIRRHDFRFKLRDLARSFSAAIAIGGVCFSLACLAFRMQTVGTQDLSAASVIHALLWAGLGLVAADRSMSPGQSARRVPYPVLAGLLWGASYPTLAVLSRPDAYVERLFSTNGLIGLWAGIGCAALLMAGFLEGAKRRSASHSGPEHGATP